ncbi:MAG TPA: Trm112 family protein [Edaphobacter sp.]|uniref:Trm112 family protein n=1 Tax=Edaphobacter sp. TaxID=1934404 RepID=UPI002B7FA264|nr:Trm112 family protein [Edaphobacter sp.]HUZ94994.1 Trm112 family protein [Edaphobacter sp.]
MSIKPLTSEDLRWIVCPVCHQPLELQPESVRCTGCDRHYPLVDGIPVLLADRAL